MIRVLIISLLSCLFFSCSSLKIDNLPSSAFVEQKTTVENTYFKQVGEEHLFRANITVFKKELTGLLVIKRINDSLHRVVLTSDFGNTLFDFSIYKDKHEVNYVMKDLDRKIILNILAKDFSYFVATTFEMNSVANSDIAFIYSGQYHKLPTIVKVAKSTNAVSEVLYTSKRKVKVSYNYSLTEKGKLLIDHYNFPLTIALVPIVE